MIILILMVKNEEKNICRCLDSVKDICDAYCITDTGSTDNTISIVNNYLTGYKYKIFQNKWKDFGHNRTLSYQNTKKYCIELGWNLESTYGLLLDADMELVNISFNKMNLIDNGYYLIQDNGYIEYYNVRFINLSKLWKCEGVTHEYWKLSDSITHLDRTIIYINDIGDGGCKENKFIRDLILLKKGIINEPNNSRYMFYLSQTYKDCQKYKKAIKYYKKRIKLGGWNEEVWYSYYMIAYCWYYLNNSYKTEYWGNLAYNYYPARAEPIFLLTRLFREKKLFYKAYEYYRIGKKIPKPKDNLFVENPVYDYLFDYEYTIIQYWVFPNERKEGLKHIKNYLSKHSFRKDEVLNNMVYYQSKNVFISLMSYIYRTCFSIYQNLWEKF